MSAASLDSSITQAQLDRLYAHFSSQAALTSSELPALAARLAPSGIVEGENLLQQFQTRVALLATSDDMMPGLARTLNASAQRYFEPLLRRFSEAVQECQIKLKSVQKEWRVIRTSKIFMDPVSQLNALLLLQKDLAELKTVTPAKIRNCFEEAEMDADNPLPPSLKDQILAHIRDKSNPYSDISEVLTAIAMVISLHAAEHRLPLEVVKFDSRSTISKILTPEEVEMKQLALTLQLQLLEEIKSRTAERFGAAIKDTDKSCLAFLDEAKTRGLTNNTFYAMQNTYATLLIAEKNHPKFVELGIDTHSLLAHGMRFCPFLYPSLFVEALDVQIQNMRNELAEITSTGSLPTAAKAALSDQDLSMKFTLEEIRGMIEETCARRHTDADKSYIVRAIQALPESIKNFIYGKYYELSRDSSKDSWGWGGAEAHIVDDLTITSHAVSAAIETLTKEKPTTGGSASASAHAAAPKPAAGVDIYPPSPQEQKILLIDFLYDYKSLQQTDASFERKLERAVGLFAEMKRYGLMDIVEGRLYGHVWALAGKPMDEFDFGKTHALDDLSRFINALEITIRELRESKVTVGATGMLSGFTEAL